MCLGLVAAASAVGASSAVRPHGLDVFCFPRDFGVVGVAVALEAERAGEVAKMFNLAATAFTDFEDRPGCRSFVQFDRCFVTIAGGEFAAVGVAGGGAWLVVVGHARYVRGERARPTS